MEREIKGVSMSSKLFSSLLLAFIISLAFLCVYYGTSFAPGIHNSSADTDDADSFPFSHRKFVADDGIRAADDSQFITRSFPVNLINSSPAYMGLETPIIMSPHTTKSCNSMASATLFNVGPSLRPSKNTCKIGSMASN